MSGDFDTVIIGPPGAKLPSGVNLDVSTDPGKGIEMVGPEDAVEIDRTPMYFVFACALLVLSTLLAAAGVFVIFGFGWSLLVGAAACAGAGIIIMRGLIDA